LGAVVLLSFVSALDRRRNTREGALSIAPYEVIAFMESVA
jgi:hypothetical protein